MITIIVMIMCLVDIVASIIVFDEYIFSLYIMLDLLAAVSLLMDLHWISAGLSKFLQNSDPSYNAKFTGLIRLGKALRVAGIMIKLVQNVKILRALKISKKPAGNESVCFMFTRCFFW